MDSFYVKDNILYFYDNEEFIEKFDISSQENLNKAFQKICIYNNSECVEFLLSLKADVDYNNNEPLIQAIVGYDGDSSIVRLLLENKASSTSNNNEPLITVCNIQNCNIDLIKLLVENNADVTSRNNKALRIASRIYDPYFFWYEEPSEEELKKHPEILEYLIEKGADKNCMSNNAKVYMIENKYFRRWRKIIFRNFIRKVITPLYYSPGFAGGEKGKKILREEIR